MGLALWPACKHQAMPVQPSLKQVQCGMEWLYVRDEALLGEGSGCTTGALYCRKQGTHHAQLAVWRRKAAQQGCFLCTVAGQHETQPGD